MVVREGRRPDENICITSMFVPARRDIKCENLLMDTDYSIKLSDFGFARNNMLKKNGQMKMSSTFCGSYAYASPEILKGVPYQPNASDIWSIGVVLFAMIFGTLPFDDTTYQKLLKVTYSADCWSRFESARS